MKISGWTAFAAGRSRNCFQRRQRVALIPHSARLRVVTRPMVVMESQTTASPRRCTNAPRASGPVTLVKRSEPADDGAARIP